MGRGLLILGNPEVTFDLMEKRSTNYSDRPESVALSMSVSEHTVLSAMRLTSISLGADWIFAFASYGAQWRRDRREVGVKVQRDSGAGGKTGDYATQTQHTAMPRFQLAGGEREYETPGKVHRSWLTLSQ